MQTEHEEGRLVAEDSQIATLNRSEIEQQISTARRYPRSIKKFRQDTLDMATLNESIADQCMYALPRDGKTIEGPSARFAEIVASAWGNCRAGARVVDDTGEFVTAQGVFHDLERNVAITYEVQRRITDKQKRRYSADMIGVTANAACSIALRNAILKGVPKAFWEDSFIEVRKVIMGDAKTLVNRRSDAVAAFQKFGISIDQICAKLQLQGIADIGLEHLVVLKGVLTAIREGDTTPEEAFDTKRPGLSVAAATVKSTPERDELVRGLMLVAEGGTTDLHRAWQALNEAERSLVGVGIEEIKAAAAAVTAEAATAATGKKVKT